MSERICSNCGHVDSSSNAESQVNVKRTRFPRRVIRDRKEFDNTYHPGINSTDLIHKVHDIEVSKPEPHPDTTKPKLCCRYCLSTAEELCHNCGWKVGNEEGGSGYTSRLKVFWVHRANSAIWELGPLGPWMLRDEPNTPENPGQKDFIAQQFLRKEKPDIPLVEMHKFGGADDKFHFTIMARAKGATLQEIWDTLTQEQKTDVIQDLKKHIKEWRQITRPYMQRVDGSELRDCVIGDCTGRGCIKTGKNEEEWLENLTPAIRKGLLWKRWEELERKGRYADHSLRNLWVKEVDEEIDKLKADFPRGGPYVLTHGDLHTGNIFVSDTNDEGKFKISAIIDWETAGFFPWWVEDFSAGIFDYMVGDDPDICHPGYDVEERNKTWDVVSPVKEAWYDGGYHGVSKHIPDRANRWYRRQFCSCRPAAQFIGDHQLGLEEEHVDVFDIDSTDSEDEEPDDDKQFRKHERKFLRWFNEISNFKSQKTISKPLAVRNHSKQDPIP